MDIWQTPLLPVMSTWFMNDPFLNTPLLQQYMSIYSTASGIQLMLLEYTQHSTYEYFRQSCNNLATISKQSCNQGISHVKFFQQSCNNLAMIQKQSFYEQSWNNLSRRVRSAAIMTSSKTKIRNLHTYSSVFTTFNNLARLSTILRDC